MLPAAVSLRNQGAGKGAVTSFLIATPESGVDSIAVSYALLDPLLTIIRPIAAFLTAVMAGIAVSFMPNGTPEKNLPEKPFPTIDNGLNKQEPERGSFEKLIEGLHYTFTQFWNDLALYFFIGVLLAGFILTAVPDHFFEARLGSGFVSMGVMLLASIPLYVCATGSTPIAAALILKGVNPGAALVFLLAGPATNVITISVLTGTLGKRVVGVYLAAIIVLSMGFGWLVNILYQYWGISPMAVAGQLTEMIPGWLSQISVIGLILISIKPLGRQLITFSRRLFAH